jgi:predicted NBD/HSP70 family sugar kinase
MSDDSSVPRPSGAHRTKPHRTLSTDVRVVLELLRESGFDSPAALEKPAGLSRTRLAEALSILEEKGLLEAQGGSPRKSGSGSKVLRLNAGRGHVIGIDIGGTSLRVALADIGGTVLGKWCTSTKEACSPSQVIEEIRKGADLLFQDASVPRRSLLAVSAGAPGITDRDAGVVLATSYLRGWKDVPLRSLLESALSVPATIENDVRVAAIGEHWQGAARGLKDFVFFAIGTGIAAGIFVNGQLVHGPDWAAGEIGYMMVPGTAVAAAGSGTPGALEEIIGGEGIRQQWLRSRNGNHPDVLEGLTAKEIFEHAQAGDALALSIVERTSRTLAYAIYNMSLVLNSSLFVLGGGVGVNTSLLQATRAILEPYNTPVRPKLALSSLGPDAQLMGAVRLALDQADAHVALSN